MSDDTGMMHPELRWKLVQEPVLAMGSPDVRWVRGALFSQFTTHLGCSLVSPQQLVL